LNDCELNNGLGSRAERYYIGDYPDGGVFSCPQARNDPGVPLRLRYTPLSWGGSFNAKNASASAIVGDIDLLLTGGRISGENKAIMEAVYDSVREVSSSDEDALHAVIEHFVAAPEFHITNNLFSSKAGAPSPRPLPDTDAPQDPKPVTDYKAIIYLFLSGAMDSFSALVPLNCELHNQYLEVRGDVAISSGLRQIDASGSNQPCDTFGLHPSLVNIHQLFQERDASFFANIGVSLYFIYTRYSGRISYLSSCLLVKLI
jgi:cullin-associated NEDD8-dissociated protein 1